MPNKTLAPVVMFVYNRPDHAKQALESLKANELAKETTLYVFADGAKEGADINNINSTRALFKGLGGFKQVVVFEKEKNEGLANSIINGVTEIVNKHGKVIVLEDDLVLAPTFLNFMNDGLDLYENSENIYSINGFMFPLNYPESKTVLLPFTTTWGWATWASKWKVFNTEMPGKEFLKSNPFLASRFNLGDYKYTDMLDFGNNSWGIKWYFSVFLRNGLNVHPTRSFVRNIGFDGSGENASPNEEYNPLISGDSIKVSKTDEIDLKFQNTYFNFFINKKNTQGKLFNYFRTIFDDKSN